MSDTLNTKFLLAIHDEEKWRKQLMNKCSVEEDKIDLRNLKESIKLSKWREKFLRYAHNRDLDNTKKYHIKIKNICLERLEKMRENSNEYRLYVINTDGRNDSVSTNDNAVRIYAEDMKEFYELRENLIKYISQ